LRSNPESTIMHCFPLDCFVPRNDGWAGTSLRTRRVKQSCMFFSGLLRASQ